ncbi:MAG TPA: carboxypeptidase regulatory-like domain-containing protein [bacterium]|nr:carboxypeptidase regulatory-like domain-containing protein [bacterium]
MRLSVLAAALAVVAIHFAPVQAWAGGAISGFIRYQGAPLPAKHRPITVDAAVCGPEAVLEDLALGKRGGVANTVVSLQGIAGDGRAFPEPSGGFVLRHKKCRLEPPVLIVAPGRDVVVLNEDHLNHDLITMGRTNPPIDVAQPKGVSRVTVRFDHREILQVRCGIHDWETAWIVVAANPYYAVSNAEGFFEIRDVPAGDYTANIWHRVLGSETRRVVVREGENLRLDFNRKQLVSQIFPKDPYISQNISRLDVNILPIRLVK